MKKFSVLLLAILLSGCSSLIARVGENHQNGHPYAGFDYALENAANCNFALFVNAPPLIIFTIPVSLADILASAAMDTVLYPVDALIENDNRHKSTLCHFSLHHQ
ncbi:YceK/YidQ family lipoprotein [Photobacterium sp. 1_MG-2023]|uniref:YceK/YidQ family lipoprotein n=1 Tax=Photobacterium sp. 1_MG-2023 TaxID=3062646 RepID=UPI0026E25130|nr:YceK/YidQ family lipoprotein [Photobacterium sp. 1_MG-2023]MDO6707571.1 YceK/YidQ family lipoprotein [Photobacterium sp. 1_MG-2023]